MTNSFLRRAIVTAGVTVLATGEFLVLQSVAGVDVAAQTGTTVQHITVTAVVVATAAAALSGWALLALLERMARQARLVWTAIAIAVLLLSMTVGPLAGTTTGAKAALALLHLTVGLAVILGLPSWSAVTATAAKSS